MEYGLMLGFNKYIIPFQHENYSLPFNVSGLDTIKYDASSFASKASSAIDRAITDTKQDSRGETEINPDIGAYLLLKDLIILHIDNIADREIFRIGQTCGFLLCCNLEGTQYVYFGNFTNLSPNAIAWRILKLEQIWKAKEKGNAIKLNLGVISSLQATLVAKVADEFLIIVLTNRDDDREKVLQALADGQPHPKLTLITRSEISESIEKAGMF
jgi:hypothetical protein